IETQSGYIYAVGASDQPGSTGLAFDDKGSGWVYYPLDQPLRSLATYGDSTVFAVGDSGYVVTNVDPANLGIGKSEEIQTELVLYPNPASEVIYFSVDGFDKGQILEI